MNPIYFLRGLSSLLPIIARSPICCPHYRYEFKGNATMFVCEKHVDKLNKKSPKRMTALKKKRHKYKGLCILCYKRLDIRQQGFMKPVYYRCPMCNHKFHRYR